MQCRAYIRSIFAEAVDQDFLPKDPARKLKTPVNLRDTDKTVLTWDQLRSALAALARGVLSQSPVSAVSCVGAGSGSMRWSEEALQQLEVGVVCAFARG